MQNRARDFAIGAIVSLSIMIPVMVQNGYFEPSPYSRVSLERVAIQGDQITIFAVFLKDDQCEFDALETVAYRLGLPETVPWVDLLPGARVDRLEGENTLAITVTADPDEYESLEIRTRHICGGQKVDKVFLTLRELREREFPNLRGLL